MKARPSTSPGTKNTTSRPGDDFPDNRYRMIALGSDAHDVVLSIGGLLCDRAMAGWHVLAYLEDCINLVPLQILGVAAAELTTVPTYPVRQEMPDVILVSAHLYISVEWVRDHVAAASRRSGVDIAVWGADEQSELPKSLRPMEYRPSHAACAFKNEAANTSAAGTPAVSQTEHFLGSRRMSLAS